MVEVVVEDILVGLPGQGEPVAYQVVVQGEEEQLLELVVQGAVEEMEKYESGHGRR